jgi:membrane-bound lytic murein transglycosylase B
MAKLPVIRTLATLAHDCRRSELSRANFLPRYRSFSAAILSCVT